MVRKFLVSLSLIFFLLVIPVAFSETSTINLLTVSEGHETGNVVKMSLETRSGTGRVFIEANLFAKEDTQFSVKMAKELICKNYNFNCNNKDFFYTIKASVSYVSGPSGGAGIALLTYANLAKIKIPDNFAITGTINSGGFIGTVGGVKEKIRAAKSFGLDKVFIPFGSDNLPQFNNESYINNTYIEKKIKPENETIVNEINKNETEVDIKITSIKRENKSVNLVDFGEQIGIKVLEVGVLDEVLFDVFKIPDVESNFKVPDSYIGTMKMIALNICDRATNLSIFSKNKLSKLSEIDFSKNYNINSVNTTLNFSNGYNSSLDIKNDFEQSGNLTSRIPSLDYNKFLSLTNYTNAFNIGEHFLNLSKKSFENNDYYSAASYCFGSALRFRYLGDLILNEDDLKEKVLSEINSAESLQKINFNDLTDIQIYSVVQDRIDDSLKSYSEGLSLLEEGRFLEGVDKLAYSQERAFTAKSWSVFYSMKGKPVSIDEESLHEACIFSIREAEMRNNYFSFILPLKIESQDTIKIARNKEKNGDYIGCIFTSLKAKAQVDAITSTFGIEETEMGSLLDVKEKITKKIVSKQAVKGHFPILGYSYLEYGNSLRKTDPYSSLLYFQIAQEQSNLDLYFPDEEVKNVNFIKSIFILICTSLISFFFFNLFVIGRIKVD